VTHLNIWNYVIIAAYLIGVVTLGLLCSGRSTSLRDYFLAGTNMPWWAVALSIYATNLSPISFLGAASWIFANDTRYVPRGSLGSQNPYAVIIT